ncbi:MAG: PilZ domain-containing protein [Candidatus Gastranaerophilales bacterium]|nr:PilZ domain-containing protein [Candidatus Gastranaerophilales bacterium]
MAIFQQGDKAVIKFDISSIRHEEVSCGVVRVEKDRMILDFPDDKIKIASYLPEGKDINLLIYTSTGIRVFDSIVINSPFEENFIVEYYEETDLIQRRDYLRVDIDLDLILANSEERVKTKVTNIGGGGVRFLSNGHFMLNSQWDFTIYSPSWDFPVRGIGNVINTLKLNGQLQSVIQFTEINELERNKIIKLCFEIEAHNLKRS